MTLLHMSVLDLWHVICKTFCMKTREVNFHYWLAGAKNLYVIAVFGIRGRLNRLPAGCSGDMVRTLLCHNIWTFNSLYLGILYLKARLESKIFAGMLKLGTEGNPDRSRSCAPSRRVNPSWGRRWCRPSSSARGRHSGGRTASSYTSKTMQGSSSTTRARWKALPSQVITSFKWQRWIYGSLVRVAPSDFPEQSTWGCSKVPISRSLKKT